MAVCVCRVCVVCGGRGGRCRYVHRHRLLLRTSSFSILVRLRIISSNFITSTLGGGQRGHPQELGPQQVPGEAARKRFSGRGYLPRTGVPHWGSLQLSPASYLVGRKLATPSQYPHPRSRPFGPRASALAPGPKKEAWPPNTMGWVRLCFDLWWTVVPLLYDFHQLYSLFCSLQLIRNKFTRLRARFQLN